jgi:prefoldin alpha subunit
LAGSSREEQFRKLVYELQMMQGSAETLQQRLGILQNALSDLNIAKESIEALKEVEEGDSILVPMGGGALVNARLGDLSNIMVNIGAEVSIEMGLEEAEENISSRLEDTDKASQSVQMQLQQILSQMERHRNTINRISEALQGAEAGV